MKRCPFCAEEIQDDAIKCRYCNEFIHEKPAFKRERWYFRPLFIAAALLTFGPFALPLVWFHGKITLVWKAIISIVVLVGTYLLIHYSMLGMQKLMQHYRTILEQLNP